MYVCVCVRFLRMMSIDVNKVLDRASTPDVSTFNAGNIWWSREIASSILSIIKKLEFANITKLLDDESLV